MVDLFATCTFIALLGPMQWSTIVEVKICVDIVFFITKMVNLNLIITIPPNGSELSLRETLSSWQVSTCYCCNRKGICSKQMT